MRFIIICTIFLSNMCFASALDYSDKYLEAEKLFKDWKKEEAKTLYLEAAKAGDANAHFALGSKYSLDKNEQISHLQKAAESGHLKGLKSFLDEVFFRSDSFRYSNPNLAMKVYRKAKSVNPNIKFYDEKKSIEAISKCLEVQSLDLEKFLAKYKADVNDSPWRWARKISTQEKNPELVLSLVCLGGHVPNEKKSAVKSFHKFWKEAKVVSFHGCDYAASNYTLAICSRDERY